MSEKFVIVGGGCAALEAAVAAREHRPAAEIVILSEEAVAPYRRPALTRMLSGAESPQFMLKKPEFFTEKRLELVLNVRVESFNAFTHEVRCADGRIFNYDRLLLATGGRARFFDWPGRELEGVTGCRSLADLKTIRAAVEGGVVKRAAVVGGGLLGLEMADALCEGGVPVTVIEAQKRLLPRQLDEEGSRMLAEIVTACNQTSLRLDAQVTRFTGTGRVSGVELADGEIIPAELVIVAVGMTPNDELAAAAGLATATGIVTDLRCQSSAPDVFAAGDCARVNHFNMGLWQPAHDQGVVAGTNLAGGDAHFKPEPAAARMAAFGTRLFSLGDLAGERCGGATDETAHSVRSLYIRNNKLAGAMLLGDLSGQLKIQQALIAGADRDELIAEGVLK